MKVLCRIMTAGQFSRSKMLPDRPLAPFPGVGPGASSAAGMASRRAGWSRVGHQWLQAQSNGSDQSFVVPPPCGHSAPGSAPSTAWAALPPTKSWNAFELSTFPCSTLNIGHTVPGFIVSLCSGYVFHGSGSRGRAAPGGASSADASACPLSMVRSLSSERRNTSFSRSAIPL